MDRCVLLNWFIDCCTHWERNGTWYQGTYIYIYICVPWYHVHSGSSQFNVTSWSNLTLCVAELVHWLFMYIHVHWYHVQFRSQCIKQSINQFSKTQRSITTAGYVELRCTSVSNKMSPISVLLKSDIFWEAKCSLFLVSVFCVHSAVCVEGVWGVEELDIYRAVEG